MHSKAYSIPPTPFRTWLRNSVNPFLGGRGGRLGRSWAVLGELWGSWGDIGEIFGRLVEILAALEGVLGDVGRSWGVWAVLGAS